MTLRDAIGPEESAELQNIMLHEPVRPGHVINHRTAAALAIRGLIRREPKGRWVVCWDVVARGVTQDVLSPFLKK